MDKIFLGSMVETMLPGIESLPINKVEILDDNGDVLAEASSSSISNGKTLTVVNPDGTTAMAAYILSQTEGYVQRSYEGRNALLDPAAELGDGVTVGGIYSVIAEQTLQFDELYRADISAPAADEIDDEYPYKSPTQRLIERNMAVTRSLITKTSEAIALRVDGLEDNYTELKTTVDGVTITDTSGTTLIKGSSIETSTLYVDAANITGTLVVGQLPEGVAMDDDIPTKLSELTNDSGYQTETGVTTIIGGTVTADYIYALGVEASVIRGNSVGLKDGSGNTVGAMQLSYTSTGMGIAFSTVFGGIQMQPAGNVFLQSGGGAFITLSDVVSLGGAPLVISSKMYGNNPPSNPVQGTLYFLRKS